MPVFKSYFMGGFECADHINRSGERINLLTETEHHIRAEEDYRLLLQLGIQTVREGICWSAVEVAPYTYDFTEVINRIQIAERLGIEQIWDICHFGYPDGLIPTHPQFTQRFISVCLAFAKVFLEHSAQTLFIVPINEISFLSWHSGDVRGTVPFAINSGFDIKYHLCKAAIATITELKNAGIPCRILTVEPLVNIHPPNGSLYDDEILHLNENQYQVMDIIAGRICPELGGREDFLDILGFNYYYNNQWEHNGQPLPWPEFFSVRKPLSELLEIVKNRYNRPVLISETGHFGSTRIEWFNEIMHECRIASERGIHLEGICIYPIVDRPDWDDLNSYCQCGIVDMDHEKNRVPYPEYMEIISNASFNVNTRANSSLSDITLQ